MVISFLVDHSGSMRGDNILHTAVALEIAAGVLSDLDIKYEILGFTTVRWQGGRTRQRWLERGRPTHPGRLNDLLHIVFRSADDTGPPYPEIFRSMLRLDLLKENVDGEALEWAERRLMARRERRRLLVLISDGAPVDDSTLSANTADFLSRHVQDVVLRIEARSAIESAALALGPKSEDHYFDNLWRPKCPEDIGTTLLGLLDEMLTSRETGLQQQI